MIIYLWPRKSIDTMIVIHLEWSRHKKKIASKKRLAGRTKASNHDRERRERERERGEEMRQ